MSGDANSPIASRADFHDAIRDALAQAGDAGAKEICFVDPNFHDWPLNDPGVIASLSHWASSHRRLVVFAQNFDDVARRFPRFVEWRRQWSHIVQCRTDQEIEAEDVPTLVFVPGRVCVRLLDRVHYRGTVSATAVDHVACREEIDALLQRSIEAFPATTLGL